MQSTCIPTNEARLKPPQSYEPYTTAARIRNKPDVTTPRRDTVSRSQRDQTPPATSPSVRFRRPVHLKAVT